MRRVIELNIHMFMEINTERERECVRENGWERVRLE